MEKEQKKPNYTLLRVIVIGVILVILVFISIGIVRYVPKALNSLANASLSIGNVFNNGSSSNTTDTSNGTNTSISTSTGGFSIRDLTSGDTNKTTDTTKTISGNTSGIGDASNAGTKNTTKTTTNTNTTKTSGSNTASSNTTRNNNSNYSYTSSNSYANTVSSSDIAVEIISKGIIDRNTGLFVPTNSFTTSDAVVVKFKIENRGTYATGAWTATVNMPASNSADAVRTLGPIQSLPAGTAVVGEARFDNPISGNQNVSITVDTQNSTQDTNRANNTTSVPLYIGGSNYNNGNYNNGNYVNGSQADMQIRILNTGTVNSYGQFVSNVNPRIGEKAAVQFLVTNAGGTATGAWSWRADITGANSSTYYSPSENSIPAGGSMKLIVGLDALNNNNSFYNGYNYNYINGQQMYFNIYIDTANNVYESNESNNSASATVTITN